MPWSFLLELVSVCPYGQQKSTYRSLLVMNGPSVHKKYWTRNKAKQTLKKTCIPCFKMFTYLQYLSAAREANCGCCRKIISVSRMYNTTGYQVTVFLKKIGVPYLLPSRLFLPSKSYKPTPPTPPPRFAPHFRSGGISRRPLSCHAC